ncbi:MAG: hypothetical protein JSU92_06590 [Deltaproteobacteria bacterium]|nr:MAG: hypothetical protein JSU92_06590 [Deltaproteobacteria bacterium]
MKTDRLFKGVVITIIFLALTVVWYNHRLLSSPYSRAPMVDLELIESQVESGNLSLHQAQFFKLREIKPDE